MSPGKAKTGLQIRMWAAAGLWGQHFLLKASELAAGGGGTEHLSSGRPVGLQVIPRLCCGSHVTPLYSGQGPQRDLCFA